MITKIPFFLLCVLSLISFNNIDIYAQSCGTSEMHQHKMKTDPVYAKKHNLMEHNILEKTIQRQNLRSSTSSTDSTVYTIPVVVHIVHDPADGIGSGANLTDAEVNNAIQILNDNFNNANNESVDVGIQFCLASKDTNNVYTTGITRTANADLTILCYEEKDLDLKENRWDPSQYMNIWVVDSIKGHRRDSLDVVIDSCAGSISGTTAGYAYFASSHGGIYDGIVMDNDYLDQPTLTHEVGHYLDLYHTFENSCANANCLEDGDFVCDTPPDESNSYSFCNDPNENSCDTDTDATNPENMFTTNEKDLVINFMDYSACRVSFTEGQRERMRIAFLEYRSSLICSNGCGNGGLTPFLLYNTNDAPSVAFSTPMSDAININWEFGDNTAGTGASTTHTYANDGVYNVSLELEYEDCVVENQQTISVCSPPNAAFTYDNSNSPYITFSASPSTNATDFSWQSTPNVGYFNSISDFSRIFSETGTYEICLTVTNSCGSDEHCEDINITVSLDDVAANCYGTINYFGSNMKFDGTFSYKPENPPLTKVTDKITATNRTILETDNVIYQAGNVIELNKDFETEYGAEFIARIDDCSNGKQGEVVSDRLEISERPNLKVYPNPFSTHVGIAYEIFEETPVNIEIYNISGGLVKVITEDDTHSPGVYDVQVDGSELIEGMYIVRIATDKTQVMQKLMKM